MKFKITSFLLGVALAVAGPAAQLAHAQTLFPNGGLAVSQQFGLNQTDVFTVDENQKLTVFSVDGGGAWHGGEEIGPPILVSGSLLAASQQFGLNQTDVFSVDENGQLEVYSVSSRGAWQGPKKVGPSGLFLPGCQVVASQQFGLTQTDVFAVDKNGQLEVFWVGTGAWQGPQKIGAPVFGAGSSGFIAAGRQVGLNQTDVFLVDEYGQLDVFWVDGGGAWQGPQKIGPAGLAQPENTPIAVSPQFGLNQTDIFLFDTTGQLYVFWADGGGAWGGPEKIGSPQLSEREGFVAASQQIGLNQTDVFAANSDGQLEVYWVDGGGAWGGPEAIGPAGFATGVSAVGQQIGLNQTDAFIIDEAGHLDVYWVVGGGAWNGPLAIN